MGGTLSPAVRRDVPYVRRIFLPYLAGSTCGGALLGLVLAGAAAAIDAIDGGWATYVVAAVIIAYGLSEFAGRSLPRPNTTRQVPEGFLRTPYVTTTSFLFGMDLGNGWTTQQHTPAFLVFCLISISTSPGIALGAGIGFGLLRGTTISAGWGVSTLEDIPERFRPLHRRRTQMRYATAAVAVLSSLVLLAS